MNKKLGLIVLILGVAIIALSFVDPLNMGATGESLLDGGMGSWTSLRLGVMAAGAVLAVWGAYGVSRKEKKK
jgi:hypothetical protein